MIVRLGEWMSRQASRFVPEPFVLAGGLTLVVFVVGLLVVAESNDSAFALVTEGWLLSLIHI